jgi:zinc and cadmium transporter
VERAVGDEGEDAAPGTAAATHEAAIVTVFLCIVLGGAVMSAIALVGDGLHNFLGGLSIAGVFLMDVRLGIAAWVAAAAHEVPQELGDFAVLVHGGWKKRSALLFNFASGLTFRVDGLVAYVASRHISVDWLVPLAAGNFLYIGASDLVPEVNKSHSVGAGLVHFVMFTVGLGLLLALTAIGDH